MSKSLHPSVQEFKDFLQEHPLLIKKIRSGEVQLQDIYEKFVLLGEDDPSWKNYQGKNNGENDEEGSSENGKQLYSKLMKHMSQLDLNQVEGHIHDLNGAIDNILTLINQFKQYKGTANGNTNTTFDLFRPKD